MSRIWMKTGPGAAAGVSISGGASLVVTRVASPPPAPRVLALLNAFLPRETLPTKPAGVMTYVEETRGVRACTRYLSRLMRTGWHMRVIQLCSCCCKDSELYSTV